MSWPHDAQAADASWFLATVRRAAVSRRILWTVSSSLGGRYSLVSLCLFAHHPTALQVLSPCSASILRPEQLKGIYFATSTRDVNLFNFFCKLCRQTNLPASQNRRCAAPSPAFQRFLYGQSFWEQGCTGPLCSPECRPKPGRHWPTLRKCLFSARCCARSCVALDWHPYDSYYEANTSSQEQNKSWC